MWRDNFWHFLAKFWPENITSRDGCFLPIPGLLAWKNLPSGNSQSLCTGNASLFTNFGSQFWPASSPPLSTREGGNRDLVIGF